MSLATTDAPHPAKLPLRATIRLAYATFFDGFSEVLSISWAWLVACALLSALSNWLKMTSAVDILRSRAMSDTPLESLLIDFAFLIAFLLAGVSIAVAWHRLLILHEAPGPSGSNIGSGSVWRYIGTGLLITVVVFVPAVVLMVPLFLMSWGGFILLGLVIYFAALILGGRLAVMLPAQAVDDRTMTLSTAWDITRGSTWRLFWGFIACTLPPMVLAQIVTALLVGTPDQQSFADGSFVIKTTVLGVVLTLYYLLTVPLAVGFLSHAYRHFSGRT